MLTSHRLRLHSLSRSEAGGKGAGVGELEVGERGRGSSEIIYSSISRKKDIVLWQRCARGVLCQNFCCRQNFWKNPPVRLSRTPNRPNFQVFLGNFLESFGFFRNISGISRNFHLILLDSALIYLN